MARQDPMDTLRDQLHAAAQREMAAPERPLHQRWRTPVAIAIAVVVGSAGIATAVSLIAVGSDEPGNPASARRYGPSTTAGVIAVTAHDPEQSLPWGVLAYRGPGGQPCAEVGELRGQALGVVQGGSFRPFGDRSGAACGDPSSRRLFYDLRHISGRSVVYGRVEAHVADVTMAFGDGKRRTARVGPGGAFLFVYDTGLTVSDFTLHPGS